MIPNYIKSVTVTYPVEGWERRIPTTLREYYAAQGYNAQIFPEERRLVLKSGKANISSLSIGAFARQRCGINFLT